MQRLRLLPLLLLLAGATSGSVARAQVKTGTITTIHSPITKNVKVYKKASVRKARGARGVTRITTTTTTTVTTLTQRVTVIKKVTTASAAKKRARR